MTSRSTTLAENTQEMDMYRETNPKTQSPLPVMLWLSRALRWGGVLALIGAAAHFILSDLGDHGLLWQYSGFLGFTGILVGIGWFFSVRWQDGATGRALLGVAAVVVPAHMAQLGSFLHGSLNLSAPPVPLMPTSLLLMVALPLLFACSWLGAASLSRRHGKALALGFFLCNLLILNPARDSSWMALQCALAFSGLFMLHHRLKQDHAFVGWDSVALRLGLLAPIAVMIGRDWMYYDFDALTFSVAMGSLAVLFGIVAVRESSSQLARQWFRLFGIGFGFLAWSALLLNTWSPNSIGEGLALIFLPYITASLIISSMLSREEAHWLRISLTVTSTLITCGLLVLMLGYFELNLSGPVMLLCGLAQGAIAFRTRERATLISASIAIIGGIIATVLIYLQDIPEFHWSWIAGIGLIMVTGAALAERYQKRIRKCLASVSQGWC